MSNKINQEIYEEIAIWLDEREKTEDDLEKDIGGMFVREGNDRIYLPERFQELLLC